MAPREPNTFDANGNVHTDFEKAFRDGYQFEYDLPYEGLQTVEFVTHHIGDLVLPSGRIVVCDPLMDPSPGDAFTQAIQPGNYPVVLSLAGFKPRQDSRIACAMLQLSQQMPVHWELAILNPDWSADYQGYGVDSGTGCFMDADAARAIVQLSKSNLRKRSSATHSQDAVWEPQEGAAYDWFEDEYCQLVIEQIQSNASKAVSDEYPYDYKGWWANLCIDENTGANVIAFGSGWGDGGYASYWGYDADGEIACLVTDFALFGSDDEDDEEA